MHGRVCSAEIWRYYDVLTWNNRLVIKERSSSIIDQLFRLKFSLLRRRFSSSSRFVNHHADNLLTSQPYRRQSSSFPFSVLVVQDREQGKRKSSTTWAFQPTGNRCWCKLIRNQSIQGEIFFVWSILETTNREEGIVSRHLTLTVSSGRRKDSLFDVETCSFVFSG